jgi:hypothetical protein
MYVADYSTQLGVGFLELSTRGCSSVDSFGIIALSNLEIQGSNYIKLIIY